MDFRMGFDPGSLQEIVRLAGIEALLNPEITRGLTESGQLLVDAAVANTWARFMNPTGQLAGSIYFWVASPMEVDIGVGVPYGHRRDVGFKGPDSLGRMFPNDPASYYATDAVKDHQKDVEAIMEVAVNNALRRIAV